MSVPNRILICAGCRQDEGSGEADRALLADALAGAGLADDFSVGAAECLSGCEAPVSLGFQGRARASYVFNGVSLATDIADIIAMCHAYLAAPDGWIGDARPLGRLRFRLRARIPALR